jgi:hypothetical protein
MRGQSAALKIGSSLDNIHYRLSDLRNLHPKNFDFEVVSSLSQNNTKVQSHLAEVFEIEMGRQVQEVRVCV